MTAENTSYNGASIGKLIIGGYPNSFLNGDRKPVVFNYGFEGDKEELDDDPEYVFYRPRVVPLEEVVGPVILDGDFYSLNPALLNKIDLGPGPVTVTTKTPNVLRIGNGGQFRRVSGGTLYYPEDSDRPGFITTNGGSGSNKLFRELAEHGIDTTQSDVGEAYRLALTKVPEIVVQGAGGQTIHILPASQLVTDNQGNPVKLLPISEIVDKERAAVYIANQEAGTKSVSVLQQMCMVESDIAQFHKLHSVSDLLDNNFKHRGSSLVLS